MPYLLEGRIAEGRVMASCMSAARAIVCAARWEAKGARNVTIQSEGRRLSVEQFRDEYFPGRSARPFQAANRDKEESLAAC